MRAGPAALLAAVAVRGSLDDYDPPPGDAVTEWAAFKRRFAREYATAEEEALRFANFRRSLEYIAASGNPALGVTKFADMTREEFAAKRLRAPDPDEDAEAEAAKASRPAWDGECTACVRFPEMATYAADSIDWSKKGAVTGIKDQGDCDNCYAFGSAGDMESSWFLAGNKLVSLSEQELTSCVGKENGTKTGCKGGSRVKIDKWIIDNGGVTSEKNYPYTSGRGSSGKCKKNKEKPIAASFDSYQQVSKAVSEEDNILEALKKSGPVSIGCSSSHMEYYNRGVDDPMSCAKRHDHAIVVVGYGTANGKNYWKIKNSWGKDWGEKGYGRVIRGKNWCGMATDAVHMRAAGSGQRYHCHLASKTCSKADKGHASLAACKQQCGGAPPPPAPPPRPPPAPGKFYVCDGTACVSAASGISKSECAQICGDAPPPPPPPAPTPPPGPRYHCANDTYQCIVQAAGHSTLEKCQQACLAPAYACNATDKTCYGVPNGTYIHKHTCEADCGAPPAPVTPAPAPVPPAPVPPVPPPATPAPKPPTPPPAPPPAPTTYKCDGGKCVTAAGGISKSDCKTICGDAPPPPPPPPPVTPAPKVPTLPPAPPPSPTTTWKCDSGKCVPEADGIPKSDCEKICG